MIVISKLLHPLFKRLRYQVLHFLRGSARPCRRHRKYLDREGWVFGATQIEVGKCSSNDHGKKKEESVRQFPYRKGGKVDALLGVSFFLEIRFVNLEVVHVTPAFLPPTQPSFPPLISFAPLHI